MSFNYPLTSPEYTQARSLSYAAGQYASQLPNTVVFAAQLNAAKSAASFADNVWHSASEGAYTDALADQLLLISSTNDKTLAYFKGRARKAFDATNLYFNETSLNQASGDYFWVLDDYPVMDRLINFDTSDNTYKVDWDVAFHRLKPIIGSADNAIGLKDAYAGFIDDTSSKFRISLSALFGIGDSSGTITAWSLDIKDGTLISGAISGSGTTTGTITLDFPAGFRHIIFSVTNSWGQVSTLPIKVWAEVRTGSPSLITGFNGATISIDVSSPGALSSCSIEMYSTELENTLDNTPICIWDEEYLDGTLGSVGGNVRFIGRLRKEGNQAKADPNYVRILSTRWTLEGADTQLNRLDNFKTFKISNAVSPAAWGEINSLNPYNAIWLLLSEFTTFASSNVINFDSDGSLFPYVDFAVEGSTMLSIVNDLAYSINAQMMFSGDGRGLLARHAFYETVVQRSALHTIADWTDSDRSADLSLSMDDIRNVAQVDAWGGEWVGGTNITPLHSMAPGLARDIGERSMTLNKQILANAGVAAAQSELNDRAGCHWFKEALGVLLQVPMNPATGFLVPDVSAWHTWTLSASDNLRGHAYTTAQRWILQRINQTHDNKAGSKKVDGTFRLETNGLGLGKTIAIVDNSDNNLPAPFALLPIAISPLSIIVPPIILPGPIVPTLPKGLKLMAAPASDGTRKKTSNFNKTNPGLNPIWSSASTGISGTALLWVADPFSTRYSSSTGKTYGWIITTTGIYYGDLNTPSFSLFHTFRAASSLRSADVDSRRSGHIVVVTDYSDGTYVTYATTGGNFTSEANIGAGGGTYPPGCYYSQHITGAVYTSVVGTGKKSTDSGASWSDDSTIDPVDDCATEIAIPSSNNASDSIKYYVRRGTTWTYTFDFAISDGSWLIVPDYTFPWPTYTPGVGWVSLNDGTVGSGGNTIYRVFSNAVITSVAVTYNPGSTNPGTNPRRVSLGLANIEVAHVDLGNADGLQTVTATFSSVTADTIRVSVDAGALDTTSTDFKIVVTGTGTNPFTGTSGGDALIRANGSVKTDITPGLLPVQSRGEIVVSATNSNIVAVIGTDGTQWALYVSQNAGESWATAIEPSNLTPWRRVFISSDKNNLLYLVGVNEQIGYSSDLGTTILVKVGDLTGNATILGVSAL
jgi:hypothetical protein